MLYAPENYYMDSYSFIYTVPCACIETDYDTESMWFISYQKLGFYIYKKLHSLSLHYSNFLVFTTRSQAILGFTSIQSTSVRHEKLILGNVVVDLKFTFKNLFFTCQERNILPHTFS